MKYNYTPIHRHNSLLHIQERTDYNQTVLFKDLIDEKLPRLILDMLHHEYAISRKLPIELGVRLAIALEGIESHPVLLLEYIEKVFLANLL